MDNGLLFVDIETVRNPMAEEYLPSVNPPSHYKDENKKLDYVMEKRAAMLEGAALDPDLGEIRAIGVRYLPTGDNHLAIVGRDGAELDVLQWFWRLAYLAGGNLCGYNVLSFDLPFLLRRSMFLGVKPPISMDMRKYQSRPITDLYAILYGWQPGRSLKYVAYRYGLYNACPGQDGGMVAEMSDAELEKDLSNDVDLPIRLYTLMNGVYWPIRLLPAYQDNPAAPALTTKLWDCECQRDFFHFDDEEECDRCGTLRDDQPNSRISELLAPPPPLTVAVPHRK